MDNQNPLKNRLSSMFRTSLGSCKSKTISVDAISPTKTHRKHHQLYQLFSPKPTSSSTHKPNKNSHKKTQQQTQQLFPARPKVSDRDSLLAPTRTRNKIHNCFPESPSPESPPPTSPVNALFEFPKRSKKKRNKKKKKTGFKRSGFESFDNYYDWFSSDDDDDNDDKTTLFSSRSLSSDWSSDSFRRKKAVYRRRRGSRRGSKGEISEVGSVGLEGKVKEGCFVVEKKSSDPYNDFTTSMVEMIVEKQIFGAKDLEDLLETFLSLNSDKHHRVIVKVFDEICEALFSNWSLS